MDEQRATEQAAPPEETQAAPESGAENWEEEAILPEGGLSAEELLLPDEDALSGESADAETPSGDADAPSEDADKPSEQVKPPEQEPEPDYKALYEAQQEKANADKYRAVFNEQLGLGSSEAVARLIARNECGGKDYPLEDAPDAGTPSAPEGSRDGFRAALAEIHSLYPDATEMPGDVMKAFADGTPLKDAYAAHRAKQDAETIATLRRENEALKKSASNRAAAPVKGVNGAPPDKKDPFIEGFDSEW